MTQQHIEKEVELILEKMPHKALSLELPGSVYDAYTAWIKNELIQIAVASREEACNKIRPYAERASKEGQMINPDWLLTILDTITSPTKQ